MAKLSLKKLHSLVQAELERRGKSCPICKPTNTMPHRDFVSQTIMALPQGAPA